MMLIVAPLSLSDENMLLSLIAIEGRKEGMAGFVEIV
jgi:hypothetical protein